MKRIRPAPMGRAFRYQRRLAHIVVTVAEKKSPLPVKSVEPEALKSAGQKSPAKKVPAKKSAAKKSAAKKSAAKKPAK
jgi:large subunit ribosomal protein L22